MKTYTIGNHTIQISQGPNRTLVEGDELFQTDLPPSEEQVATVFTYDITEPPGRVVMSGSADSLDAARAKSEAWIADNVEAEGVIISDEIGTEEVVVTKEVIVEDKLVTKSLEVEEPAKIKESHKREQGKLPDGFPGKAALEEAEVDTFAKVRKMRDSEEGLTSVPGIGEATAKSIIETLED